MQEGRDERHVQQRSQTAGRRGSADGTSDSSPRRRGAGEEGLPGPGGVGPRRGRQGATALYPVSLRRHKQKSGFLRPGRAAHPLQTALSAVPPLGRRAPGSVRGTPEKDLPGSWRRRVTVVRPTHDEILRDLSKEVAVLEERLNQTVTKLEAVAVAYFISRR